MTDTQHRSTTESTDVHDMVVVHRVFRRELRLIPELIVGISAGDVDRAGVIAGHARLILSGLHLHHTSEDDLLWPLLEERAPKSTELLGRMQSQHAGIDDRIARIGSVLDRWEHEARPAVAREAAGRFDELFELGREHLDEEERSVLPLAAQHLTPAEWGAVGQASVAKMSRSELPLMFGAVLEETSPEEREQMLAVLPMPVRLLMRTWGSRRYRRYITEVRGPR